MIIERSWTSPGRTGPEIVESNRSPPGDIRPEIERQEFKVPVLDPKARLISFRLSEREYQRLRAVCAAHHARSVSDFVRSGIHWIIANSNQGLIDMIATTGPYLLRSKAAAALGRSEEPEVRDSGTVAELKQRVEGLACEVRRLSRALRRKSFGEVHQARLVSEAGQGRSTDACEPRAEPALFETQKENQD